MVCKSFRNDVLRGLGLASILARIQVSAGDHYLEGYGGNRTQEVQCQRGCKFFLTRAVLQRTGGRLAA